MQITVELTLEQQAALPRLPVELIPRPPEGSYITNPRIVDRDGAAVVIEYELTSTVQP